MSTTVTMTATQAAELKRNDRTALAGAYLTAINGEPVGGEDGWLIEMISVPDASTPDEDDPQWVDLTVWVGDWMVGLQVTTYAGHIHGDQTVTVRTD